MKYLKKIQLLLLVYVCISCDKNEMEEALELQDLPVVWVSEKPATFTLNETEDSLYLVAFRQGGKLEMKVRFKGQGKYILSEVGTVNYYKMGGGDEDEVKSTYSVDANDRISELDISKWDAETKAIEGLLQIRLKKAPASGTAYKQENIDFTGELLKGTAVVKKPSQSTGSRKTFTWKPAKAPEIKLLRHSPQVDSLKLSLYHETGTIHVLVDFKGTGKYKAPVAVSGFSYEYENDKIRKVFQVHKVSEVEITEWDQNTKMIKGTFDITLQRTVGPTAADVEVIQFKEGAFEGDIIMKHLFRSRFSKNSP
ncbi:hypothetical protein EFA69_08790 [Rufibacter immobilis]|uniref:Uncharacterized protein n=1 Tax=Rufibacter immobilis TaxID=1348778 RepID=A0A3M9MWW8_9BACT|nr:hypothetical protein [Rufibacter immobilis]RNI29645.1 hypothetical protein EFA69_08790 [Rufibacter immobilis]